MFRSQHAMSIENDALRVTVLRGGGHISEILDNKTQSAVRSLGVDRAVRVPAGLILGVMFMSSPARAPMPMPATAK